MPSPRVYVNLDGAVMPASEARISVMDHGFLYGDSVYETLRTFARAPFLLTRHLERLERSAGRIYLEIPLERRALEEEVSRSIREFPGAGDIVVRIVVSRGAGPIGLDIGLCKEPRIVIYAIEMLPGTVPAEAQPDSRGGGVAVVISRIRRNSPSALDPSIKSGNFLNNILAFRDACAAGACEAILCTADGYLAEGATSNIYVVADGCVRTPRAEGILDGITRAVLFEEGREHGIEFSEANIPPEALFTADEAFLTSSVRGVVPIASVNGSPIGDGRRGPLTHRLQRLYQARLEKECLGSRPEVALGA